jgi:hypothetical protein
MSATKSLLYLDDPVFERVNMFWLTGPGGGAFTRDTPYGLYAQGEAQQVYAPALRGAGSVAALSFPLAPQVAVSIAGTPHVPAGGFSYPALTGFAFAATGQSTARSLVVVNNTGAQFRLDVAQVFGDAPHSFVQKSADPATPVDGNNPLPVTSGGGTGSDQVPVAPYSITRVDVS